MSAVCVNVGVGLMCLSIGSTADQSFFSMRTFEMFYVLLVSEKILISIFITFENLLRQA